MKPESDISTAQAFATSWNNLPAGSVYTTDQALDWFQPLNPPQFVDKQVLEMGCGNGSLLLHVLDWQPKQLVGVDLGDSVRSAQANCATHPLRERVRIIQKDLLKFTSEGFDIVYSIGVLHHLKNPQAGFQAVVHNTKPGGHFHCWVYGKEGNALVRFLVEPLRKLVCHAPWWFTKYAVATPLAIPFYLYAQASRLLAVFPFAKKLPMHDYMLWVARRDFWFCRHVAFDQLVTPQTVFLSKPELEEWLTANPEIESSYLLPRNGNSWKFGGIKKR